MTDEVKLNRDMVRGSKAKQVLENELFRESHDKIERALIDAWIGSDPRDTEGRERCFQMLHANRKHRAFFESVIHTAKISEAELKQMTEQAERKKRFGLI